MFRIFPSVPITWRSSSCIQFGADDPVLIDGLLPGDASLIEDLRLGIGSAQFYARAQELGVDLSRASSLITLLGEASVLVPDDADSGTVPKGSPVFAAARIFNLSPDRVSQVLGARPVLVTGPLRSHVEAQLAALGFAVAAAHRVEELDLMAAPVVVTSSHLVPDLNSAMWLSDREVDHCQVVLGEQAVEITGLIRPGSTPCSVCACLHRKDSDAGWLDQHPRLRALPERESLSDPAARILGAAHVVQILRQALLRPQTAPVRRVVTLDAGEVADTGLVFHDRCQCRTPVPDFGSVADQAQ
ncbi:MULTISPECIES: hypothetical protein [Brevibacterium]|jgi:hypothetical protein|uniref:Bacteriocin biosynthesis cyclodehydratase domain-containing protein n=2 Tax=Brevibacterium TaxID=1696 RepID=A0A142NN06_BRELN|nr:MULTISPECIES: hypothetical protein [Brevibacterium]AMT93729.1 hypothetical protein A2T55_08010 [Brevibacterium linens]HHX47396.1 hypothetical protein [Brevibacterium sp.]HJE78704.1 hypothetical protein [Brevibacterium epidermidis]